RRHEALQQPLVPGLNHRETHAPQAAAHEVHAEQAGDQEVDVAGARLGDPLVAREQAIGAALTALQRLVHLQARQAALGARRVVTIEEPVARHDEPRDAPGAEGGAGRTRVEHGGGESAASALSPAACATPTLSSPGPRFLNAMPRAKARTIGNPNTQKIASGSR